MPDTAASAADRPGTLPLPLPLPAPLAIPPRDPQARRDFLSDAVMKAIARAVRLLDDDDTKVALTAVHEILVVETTRMRHGSAVLGAHPAYLDDLRKDLGDPTAPVAEFDRPTNPEDEFDDEIDDEFDDEWDEPPAFKPCQVPASQDFTRDPDYPGGPILSRDPAHLDPPTENEDEGEDEPRRRMTDLRANLDPTPARPRFELESAAPLDPLATPARRPLPDWLISLRE